MRSFVFVVVLRNGRNRLQSFAKAHVIGENPIEIHHAQPLQPMDPFDLIGAQFCVDLFGIGDDSNLLLAEHLTCGSRAV